MKIYTKTGDDGTTSLRNGERVSKDSPKINAYGNIDELSSFIGLAASFSRDKKLVKVLQDIQQDLFMLASGKFDENKIYKLESLIDEVSTSLKPLKSFILPGGTKLASTLHAARTICRRTERACVSLSIKHSVPYLNRLSDLLFTLARKANKGKDIIA